MGVKVAVARFSTPASTGTNSWTTADLGGLTPVGAIIIPNWAESDGVAIDGIVGGITFTDGTRSRAFAFSETHNVTTTANGRSSDPTDIFRLSDTNNNTDVSATFDAWVTNGISIDFSNIPANQKLYTVIFFAGSGVTAHAGAVDLGATDVTINVTDPGFQADLVFLSTIDRAESDIKTSQILASFGVCTPGVNDACYGLFALTGAATSGIGQMVRSNKCLQDVLHTGATWSVESATNTNGLDLTTRDGSAATIVCHYLALKLDGVSVDVGNIDLPTSNGDDSQTDPTFRPQAVILGLTSLTAVDTFDLSGDEVGGWGISAFTKDAEFCNAWANEDNSALSDVQSLSDNVAVNLSDGPGTNLHTGTFTGFTPNGWDWNFSNSDATARKAFYAAIGTNSIVLKRRREYIGIH